MPNFWLAPAQVRLARVGRCGAGAGLDDRDLEGLCDCGACLCVDDFFHDASLIVWQKSFGTKCPSLVSAVMVGTKVAHVLELTPELLHYSRFKIFVKHFAISFHSVLFKPIKTRLI